MAWRAISTAARIAVGPLVLVGFFLPWTHGPGVFAETAFSGYDLVGTAGRLQQLDLSPTQGALLWLLRLGILAVPVAATWQTLLAPAHPKHFGYQLSGWYLVVAAVTALIVGLARAGLVAPPLGLVVWWSGAVLFLVTVLASSRTAVQSKAP